MIVDQTNAVIVFWHYCYIANNNVSYVLLSQQYERDTHKKTVSFTNMCAFHFPNSCSFSVGHHLLGHQCNPPCILSSASHFDESLYTISYVFQHSGSKWQVPAASPFDCSGAYTNKSCPREFAHVYALCVRVHKSENHTERI